MAGQHARLSASGAERWMNCPGSPNLIDRLALDPNAEEPEYTTHGLAAHELASTCLETGADTWEHIGSKFYGDVEIDQEISDAVQVYLDAVRGRFGDGSNKFNTLLIEKKLSLAGQPDMGGTCDAGIVGGDWLHIYDYKHGAGIFVEAKGNAQLRYYAYLLLKSLPNMEEIKYIYMTIVQPRLDFGDTEIIRSDEIDARELLNWGDQELLGAIDATKVEGAPLATGEWCRFCPAKLVCPAMKLNFDTMVEQAPIAAMPNENLAVTMDMVETVKIYIKAVEAEIYARLNKGVAVPGYKLVPKKANRVWKDGADKLLEEAFGMEAFTEPSLKSPSVIEKLVGGKDFTAEHAYKPVNGLTVAPTEDRRVGVKVKTPAETFRGLTGATKSA